jgi:voltage-gated potassium channel
MWWAIETLTTVGYGDLVPVTVLGKIVGGIVTIIGVAAVALFTSVITVSFIDQLRLRREALREAVETQLAKGPLSMGGYEAIEELTERLGLPETEPEEILEETAPEHAICPHCGGPLTGTRPARVPLLAPRQRRR